MGLIRLCTLLPYRWLIPLGKGLGRVILKFSKKLRHNCLVNYDLCFPELSVAEKQHLLRCNFESLGIAVFETIMGWWAPNARLRPLLHEVTGREFIEKAYSTNRGVILLTGHFMGLEMVGRILALNHPTVVTYRRQKLAILEQVMLQSRKKYYVDVIERSQVRKVVRALAQHQKVFIAGDVDVGAKGVFVPFFNVMTSTAPTPAKLAKMTDAWVLPCFFYRRDDGRGYDAVIEPPLENFPSGDLLADMTRINAILEKGVRYKPEQYLWHYQRFKSRPGDTPNNIYDMSE